MSGVNADPAGDRIGQFVAGLELADLAGPLSALSFWSAIALPVLYLPILAAGIESVAGLATFLGLFGLHVAALLGGQHYGDESDR